MHKNILDQMFCFVKWKVVRRILQHLIEICWVSGALGFGYASEPAPCTQPTHSIQPIASYVTWISISHLTQA